MRAQIDIVVHEEKPLHTAKPGVLLYHDDEDEERKMEMEIVII
jgi:hypothetical protein